VIVVCEEGLFGEHCKEERQPEGCLQQAEECVARKLEMSYKKVMLVFLLVLGLSLFSVRAFAQGEDVGERVTIIPWKVGLKFMSPFIQKHSAL
jgi:hypothetical protein